VKMMKWVLIVYWICLLSVSALGHRNIESQPISVAANWTVCANEYNSCYISFVPNGGLLLASREDQWDNPSPMWNFTLYYCNGGYSEDNCKAEWKSQIMGSEWGFTTSGYMLYGNREDSPKFFNVQVCHANTTGKPNFECAFITRAEDCPVTTEVSPTGEYLALRFQTLDGYIQFQVFETTTYKSLFSYTSKTQHTNGCQWNDMNGVLWLSDSAVLLSEGSGGAVPIAPVPSFITDVHTQLTYKVEYSWYNVYQNDYQTGGYVCQNMFATISCCDYHKWIYVVWKP